jgi:homeobox-leucine zipper protein
MQLLRLKEKLAETEEEKSKVMAAATTAVGGASSPSSSSFSTVTHHAAMVEQFEMQDAEADLTFLSEYAYNNYVMDLAAGGYLGGVYDDQFS